MAYDLEEQEQIASIKAFWDRYGTLLTSIATVLLLAVAGWRGWGLYQDRQAGQAAQVYEQLRGAVDAHDAAKIKEVAGTLFESYGSTVYGRMAALTAARAWVDAGDVKAARAPLQWLVDQGRDDEFSQVARLRLSALLLDEKSYDQALALVDAARADERFAAEFADRRGDIQMAQHKVDLARKEWSLALEKLEPTSGLRSYVQMKLDAVGGAGA